MARKLVLWILICFCSVLLMSHNSFAAVSVFDLKNYSVIASSYRSPIFCQFDGSTNLTSSNACGLNTDGEHTLTAIRTNGLTWQMKKGDIVEFDVATYTSLSNFNNYPLLYIGNGSTYNNLLIIDVSEKINDTSDHTATIDLWLNGQTDYTGAFWDGQIFARMYHFTAQVLNDFSGDIGLSASNPNYPIFNYKVATLNGVHDNFYFRISNLMLWRKNANTDEASNTLKQEKQDVQNASNQSEQDGASSQTSAEGASQSLLTATGSVISALTNAPATDCNINLTTTGNSSSFTSAIGSLNLCSNVPSGILSFVQGLLALVLTPIVFYYCYHIVQYMINLFKEYQN